MPESVSTVLDEEEVESFFESNDAERSAFISSQFDHLSESDQRKLLAGFCTGDREDYNGEPCVMGVSIDDYPDEEGFSGTVDVYFTGSAYYGCKDMDRLDEHEETVSFRFEPATRELWFETSPPPPVSERYDEI